MSVAEIDARAAVLTDEAARTSVPPSPTDVQHARDGDSEYAHLQPIWRRFTDAAPDSEERAQLREQLVLSYRTVVEHIAWRYTRHNSDTHADIVQVGMVGLIKAIDNVAPERITTDVLAYLIPCIRGEMQRYFRDRTWMMRTPRRLKDLSIAINRETLVLTQRLGRAPRPSELAAALDTDVSEIIEALHARDDQHPGSLDVERRGDERMVIDTIGGVDHAYATIENREAIRPLIEALPSRERTILTMRFFGDMTQSQIAQQLGISQMHVSRLLAQTLARLRRSLADAEQPRSATAGSPSPAVARTSPARRADPRRSSPGRGRIVHGSESAHSANRPPTHEADDHHAGAAR